MWHGIAEMRDGAKEEQHLVEANIIFMWAKNYKI